MDISGLPLQKKTVNAFRKRNIRTSGDLCRIIPRAYHDYRSIVRFQDAGEKFSAFAGELVYCDRRMGKKWYLVLKLMQGDGTMATVLMFAETYRYGELCGLLHKRVVVLGKACFDGQYGWSIRQVAAICPEAAFKPGIEPVYPKINGITDEAYRAALEAAISCQEEILEEEVRENYGLPSYPKMLQMVHHPMSEKDISAGRYAFVFHDLLYLALGLVPEGHGNENASCLLPLDAKEKELLSVLPYGLTRDQEKVLDAFDRCASTGKRFNALVQGDVGCGKTAVAAAMMARACGNGCQAVLMAPREVLARQHYAFMENIAAKLGLTCAYLGSGLPAGDRKKLLGGIADGSIQLIVGTHSCLSEGVEYNRLALTVTDEEHLFGVAQKRRLEAKAEEGVHAVAMSATPIPRSLATVLYGNGKEILQIRTMPPGRLPVKTCVQKEHGNIFPFIEKQVANGHQCYVVCPAIEDNEEYGIVAIESIEKMYRDYFDGKGIKIGVVHGRMPQDEAAGAIAAFSRKETMILVSTTVIEVGVNIPEATVIVVEQAERFGLASLHQLRGRVGRSTYQSYCFLVSSKGRTQRLSVMERTNDGFVVAEEDLKQRGGGDVIGMRQAGHNRFVDEMFRYPSTFMKASEAAVFCRQNGYGEKLLDEYGPGAESAGEGSGF